MPNQVSGRPRDTEETWPEGVVRSKATIECRDDLGDTLGKVIKTDGPRPIVCADCGQPIVDGLVFHVKPETYRVTWHGWTFYMERHIGVTCGCAKKRGLL